MSTDSSQLDPTDRAVQSRLRRLGESPVEISRLEQSLSGLIEHEERNATRLRSRRRIYQGFAALVAAALGAILLTVLSQRPQTISFAEVIPAHEGFLERDIHLIPVSSVAEANYECQALWPEAPVIPEIEGAIVRGCCVEDLGRHRAACLHFERDGVEITLAVVSDSTFGNNASEEVSRAGRVYMVTSQGRFELVATTDSDGGICLVGALPRDELVAIADSIRL